jgi:YebC/PmpR family DNA-binding regulatory protein
MSGHSKWASIKHKKAIVDQRRGKAFTTLSRHITVAAKSGGGDVDGNPALALAVQKAKDASMPKDNIQRAIDKGTGAGADAETFEDVLDEGYGPGGVALLIEALTDNRNRTGADIRNIFSKNGGSVAEPGSVAWQFERKGVIILPKAAAAEDDLMLVALDNGAEDIEDQGDTWQLTSPPTDLNRLRTSLEEAGITIESADLTMLPSQTVPLQSEGDARQVLRVIDALEDHDDVQNVYANFDIPDSVLELVEA